MFNFRVVEGISGTTKIGFVCCPTQKVELIYIHFNGVLNRYTVHFSKSYKYVEENLQLEMINRGKLVYK